MPGAQAASAGSHFFFLVREEDVCRESFECLVLCWRGCCFCHVQTVSVEVKHHGPRRTRAGRENSQCTGRDMPGRSEESFAACHNLRNLSLCETHAVHQFKEQCCGSLFFSS